MTASKSITYGLPVYKSQYFVFKKNATTKKRIPIYHFRMTSVASDYLFWFYCGRIVTLLAKKYLQDHLQCRAATTKKCIPIYYFRMTSVASDYLFWFYCGRIVTLLAKNINMNTCDVELQIRSYRSGTYVAVTCCGHGKGQTKL